MLVLHGNNKVDTRIGSSREIFTNELCKYTKICLSEWVYISRTCSAVSVVYFSLVIKCASEEDCSE